MSSLTLSFSSSPPPPSPPTTQATSIDFENAGEHPVSVFWVDFDGVEVAYATLAPGGVLHQPTYVGHVWRLRARGEALGWCAAIAVPAACVVRRRGLDDDEPVVPPHR